MQPPNRSFRSSTNTCQPAFASSAPHASELTPLPTMTASKSLMGEDSPDRRLRRVPQLAELGVRHEATVAHATRFHLGEQLRVLLRRDVEPELFRLDPDRVDAALLAEHDPSLRGDEARGVGLDRRRI